jgi:hypothetical protein
VRLVLDRLDAETEPARAAIRAGAAGSTTPLRLSTAAVDQRRNACPVDERTAASMRHDGQEPRPRPGRLLLRTRPIAPRSRVDAPASPRASSSVCCSLEPARRCFTAEGVSPVHRWLQHVAPLFGQWPPDHAAAPPRWGVDSAAGMRSRGDYWARVRRGRGCGVSSCSALSQSETGSPVGSV